MPRISRSASATPKYDGITYNGGPIIDDANGVNVYYIWYGGDCSKDCCHKNPYRLHSLQGTI